MALKYKRILLKISGEALGGEKGMGFDEPTMDAICGGVKKAHELGVQIGIVVGGGNFWRGRSSGKMERTLADKIGMLATVMNALAVSDKLEQLGVPTEVFTSITMPQVAPAFTRKDALRAMDEGKIAVFGGGTGNPFFSTDTATALRAVEVSWPLWTAPQLPCAATTSCPFWCLIWPTRTTSHGLCRARTWARWSTRAEHSAPVQLHTIG